MGLLGPLTAKQQKHIGDRIWIEGDRDLAAAPARIAVVGSRRASVEGLRRAAKVAAQLASAGVVVVSGLAVGIDAAAHRAALRAGGRTIAVIGTPLDGCYPAEHRELQDLVALEHLLVSPIEPGKPPDFVRRNRVMALFARASIIVEAGDASGTSSHAAEQRRLGRPVFVMRSQLERVDVRWPHNMIEAGAAQVLDDTDQVLEFLSR